MGSDDECNGVNNGPSVHASSALLLLLLAPAHFVLVSWFIRRLLAVPGLKLTNPMVSSVLIYVILSSLAMVAGLSYFVLYPLSQTGQNDKKHTPSLQGCQFLSFLSWWSSTLSYVSLVFVFYTRLVFSLKGTANQISNRAQSAFLTSMVSTLLLCSSLIIFRTTKVDCWTEVSFGWLSDQTPLFPKSVRYCELDSRYEWISLSIPIFGIGFFLVSSSSITCLFFSRLHQMTSGMNHSLARLAEKSAVLSCVGLMSTVTSLMMIPLGVPALILVDYTLNTILLTMLYNCGDPWYRASFGRLMDWFTHHCDKTHTNNTSASGSRGSGMRPTMERHSSVVVSTTMASSKQSSASSSGISECDA